ncbi:MAG: hypothetical protein LQ343_001539 [Gyalolechia ehrenbergii]|nr:MAG: hypothetical protein LQ343_001539 [Gyalolechia ehrenbergii]
MEQQSSVLMSAKIHFVDARLSLVHIPLNQYQSYLQSILKLIFPAHQSHGDLGTASQPHEPGVSWANQYAFLNVSVTPIECSIVCTKVLAEELFAPNKSTAETSATTSREGAVVSLEDFVVMSVEGEGLEAGKRVLELTSPLALAGISIFFFTTYFSDYILVPAKSKKQVIRALEDRGFQFEERAEAYVNPAARHDRNKSSTSSFGTVSPSTPPPVTVSELQARTFALLKRREIIPRVDTDIRLLQCAGRRDLPSSFTADEMGLQVGLTRCLVYQPRFLSLTLTSSEPASLLIERKLIANFDSENVLLGNKEDFLVPIMLDLEPLPLEATGIVCGVADRLCGRSDNGDLMNAIEMSYLSTARTGTVIVEEKDLKHAMEALRIEENDALEY